MEYKIASVRERIAAAAKKAGRNADEISLIAVSKTVDAQTVRHAFTLGLTAFGENRPQELRDKISVVPEAEWHLIGQLQSNKIKYVVGKARLIQSVASEELLHGIDDYAKKIGIVQDILIQINISHEQSKSGINENNVDKMLELASKQSNIRVCGLMTIGSAYASEYELKKMFEKCYNIFIDNQQKKYDNIDMQSLSMGMSGDFETAIEMGANMVRIGTAIFGERDYII